MLCMRWSADDGLTKNSMFLLLLRICCFSNFNRICRRSSSTDSTRVSLVWLLFSMPCCVLSTIALLKRNSAITGSRSSIFAASPDTWRTVRLVPLWYSVYLLFDVGFFLKIRSVRRCCSIRLNLSLPVNICSNVSTGRAVIKVTCTSALAPPGAMRLSSSIRLKKRLSLGCHSASRHPHTRMCISKLVDLLRLLSPGVDLCRGDAQGMHLWKPKGGSLSTLMILRSSSVRGNASGSPVIIASRSSFRRGSVGLGFNISSTSPRSASLCSFSSSISASSASSSSSSNSSSGSIGRFVMFVLMQLEPNFFRSLSFLRLIPTTMAFLKKTTASWKVLPSSGCSAGSSPIV
mmetsp:Transcript_27042/g.58996  ORF Transcript_27042/g.58996 Transcript_27042/m.58996 type:complete len:347 (-) Transcript_27042:1478-2518(-)